MSTTDRVEDGTRQKRTDQSVGRINHSSPSCDEILDRSSLKGKDLFVLWLQRPLGPWFQGKPGVFVTCYLYDTERRQKAQAGTRGRGGRGDNL